MSLLYNKYTADIYQCTAIILRRTNVLLPCCIYIVLMHYYFTAFFCHRWRTGVYWRMRLRNSIGMCCSVLRCVAVCYSVLQCVAVCCSVLQCVAECCSVLQCVAECCRVLWCVVVCCSVLPHGPPQHNQYVLDCNMLQCVAVCCSMLQCISARIRALASKFVAMCCGVMHYICAYSRANSIVVSICVAVRGTGWRRLIGCLKLQVIFCKRATNFKALLRKMTYKDEASYGISPLCNVLRCLLVNTHTHTHIYICIYLYIYILYMNINMYIYM